jgi:hypothetical protein
MVKIQIFIGFVFLGLCAPVFGQLTVNPRKMPFYDIVEWPSNGVLLIAKDPKGNTTQQEVTYVNTAGEIKWQEQYLPQVKDPKLILSEYSNYLYFLDQLQPDNGKIFYNQATFSGNIRKGSIYFPPIFRTLTDFDDVNSELIDVVNATDNLIFHFRLRDKKAKTYVDALVLLNHYSLKTTALRLPGTYGWDEVDKKEKSLPYFAGSKDNENYFAYYSTRDKKKGIEVIIVDKKGNFSGTNFFELPMATAGWSTVIPVYLTGAWYMQELKKTLPTSIGRMVYLENTWYWLGANADGLAVYKFDNQTPVKVWDKWNVPFKKSAQLGLGMTVSAKGLVVIATSDAGCHARLLTSSSAQSQANLDGRNVSALLLNDAKAFSFFWNGQLHQTLYPQFSEQLNPVLFEEK